MKQLIQNFKTGDLALYDVPAPTCKENGALIRTSTSLVSAGTEKMLVDFAKKSILSKAKDRPDLVKQTIDKMKKEGFKNTLDKVFTKLDTPIPLGYSLAGTVIETACSNGEIVVGDRVACGGAGYANHSEINYVPQNLIVKIPKNVNDIEASFVAVGAIALQGVRQANVKIGEKVAVLGLGLIGQLTVMLLKANGCTVIGSDIDPNKLELAKQIGCDEVCFAKDLIRSSDTFSHGRGVDSVLIAASTNSNQPVIDAAEISRTRGKVILVGMVGMNIPRDLYYKKELEIKLSMSYGPGRYDPIYEEKGHDYPFDLVRWTEQRNFEAFLELISTKKINPIKLVTHNFEFNDAIKAYDLIRGESKENHLGVVLKYNQNITLEKNRVIQRTNRIFSNDQVNLGLIGAGNFTKSVLLPILSKINKCNLISLCTASGISANHTGKKYNFKFITTSKEEVFSNSEINAVLISNPHNNHARDVIKAMNSKQHCFVEKPLCINESEINKIINAYNGEQVLQVGFNRRFSPMITKMKSYLDGPVHINYRIFAGIIPQESWIQDKDIGGGRIIGEVCHFIDTCSYLAGSDVQKVYATTSEINNKSIPKEDNLSIVLNYKNGSMATITYYAIGDKRMPKEYIEVFQEGLSLQMNNFRKLTIYKNNKKTQIKNSNQNKGFHNELEQFLDSIKNGTNPIDFKSIINTTKTTFKIRDSIKTGHVININE